MNKETIMRLFSMIIAILTIAAAPVAAHEGPRIWIGSVDGKVTTFTSDNDLDPTTYEPARLFTAQLQEFFGIFTAEFPGYEVRQTGGDIPPGTTFGFNITGPLLYFDDFTDTFVTVQAHFGPPQPGPTPQMALSLGMNIRTTGSSPVTGFNFFTFHEIGDHSHLSYTLLGDGLSAGGGPTGVYAIGLELESAEIMSSEIYYLLIGKDIAESDPLFQQAHAVAQATLVPSEVPGDMNCDGAFDEGDIPAFVLAIISPDAFGVTYPGCDPERADMNGDGESDALDTQGFTNALLN